MRFLFLHIKDVRQPKLFTHIIGHIAVPKCGLLYKIHFYYDKTNNARSVSQRETIVAIGYKLGKPWTINKNGETIRLAGNTYD